MGNNMNKVLPGLYIGSNRDAHDVEELRENKISHILCVLENCKPDLRDKEYLCLPMSDSPSQNIICFIPQCNVFIHKARRTGNVLVHCQMGVSRSAAIVVAYLMTVTRLSWKNALIALKAARSFVNPNLGFQKQLMIYEQRFVEEERTRLKGLFPLSQFNDVVHCEQLLEKYRLSLLRNEKPMEVDVYPLALNAYGLHDFNSIKCEPTPVSVGCAPTPVSFGCPPTSGNVVFCGPVSDASSEVDCLVQRLERVHLGETFKRLDTFSCGSRPSQVIKTKAPTLNAHSASSLNDDDVQNTGPILRESILGNAILSGSLKGEGLKSRPFDAKTSDDAAVEVLFANSANLSKNSADSDAKNNAMQEHRSQLTASSNDAAVDSIFRDSVDGNRNSINRPRQTNSKTKESSPEIQVSSKMKEKELRQIGRAYLGNNFRIWRDMSDSDEDDDKDKNLSAVKIANNNQLMKTNGNNPTQHKVASNDASQATITSNASAQKTPSCYSEEVITLLPSQSQLDQLFDNY